MLIDSHAHLDMKDFKRDLDDVLERALQEGLTHIITIGIDLVSSQEALKLANQYDYIYSTIGFHPHNANEAESEQLEKICEFASEPKVVAWGEIGLDFYRNYSPREKQMEVFKRQLDLAYEVDLPVIIHERDAYAEVYAILKKKRNRITRGVIHCFSGDYDQAMAYMDLGYYISFTGKVTYKNMSKLQDAAAGVPLDRILVETDAPFLTPVPKRGKRNEPAFVTHTAQKIAELRNMSFEEVAQQTSENTKRLFGI
jgi:TatD DNase family protein